MGLSLTLSCSLVFLRAFEGLWFILVRKRGEGEKRRGEGKRSETKYSICPEFFSWEVGFEDLFLEGFLECVSKGEGLFCSVLFSLGFGIVIWDLDLTGRDGVRKRGKEEKRERAAGD